MLITLRAQRVKERVRKITTKNRLKSIKQLHVYARLFQFSVPESNTEYYSHTAL